MRARILPPEDWSRLEGTEIPAMLPYMEPQNIAIAAVEDNSGEIAASVCVLRVTHFEGLSLRDKGNAGVFRALIRQAYAVPRVRGESWVLGGAEDGDTKMDSLCRRLGGRPLSLKFYAMPVGV